MTPLIAFSKSRKYSQDFFGGRNGAAAATLQGRYTVTLFLLLSALSALMGCGYAGRPPGMGEAQKNSTIDGGVIQIVPSSIGFGKVAAGMPSSQSVRLSNIGQTDVQITKVIASGSGFSVSGLSLPVTLPAGQSTTFTAAFLSRTTGGVFGGISVSGDGTDSGTTIDMSATVVADQLQLTPSTGALTFGNDVLGNAETQNVILTNTGNMNVTVLSVAAMGAGFGVAGGRAGFELAPGQTINVAVTFNPTSAGAATGSLVVTSSAAPLQIALSGTATNPGQHSVVLNWSPSASTVAGYFVYRGDGVSGPLSKLSAGIIPTTSYRDATVVSGQTYNYAVTSVGDGNVESSYSNQVALTIPSP